MSDAAAEFLETWTLQLQRHAALSDEDARTIAETWESDAADNGIRPEALRHAAGGDLAAYLQRTFGREGSGLQLD